MSTLTDRPLLVFGISLVALWLCAQLGAALRRRQEAQGGRAPETFTVILTATLTLLGLIIGFTFSMAVSRYDLRKSREAEEANAIGTEYVRVGMLRAAGGAALRPRLNRYIDLRVRFYNTRDDRDLAEINAETLQL